MIYIYKLLIIISIKYKLFINSYRIYKNSTELEIMFYYYIQRIEKMLLLIF